MVCGMRLSHQQKRISELCSKVIATNDPTEFAQAVAELRVALRAQLDHLKQLVYFTMPSRPSLACRRHLNAAK